MPQLPETNFYTRLKAVLLQNPDHGAHLIQATGAADVDRALQTLIFESDELTLQKTLAPVLRALAIEHLRHGQTPVAKQFREENFANLALSGDPDYAGTVNDYCDRFSRAYQFATQNEGVALGELLGLSVRLQMTQDHGKVNPERGFSSLYDATNNDNVAIVLYNQPRLHWFFYEGRYDDTYGDGNCLFHSFAQSFRQICFYELVNTQAVNPPTPEMLAAYSRQDLANNKRVVEIQRSPSPANPAADNPAGNNNPADKPKPASKDNNGKPAGNNAGNSSNSLSVTSKWVKNALAAVNLVCDRYLVHPDYQTVKASIDNYRKDALNYLNTNNKAAVDTDLKEQKTLKKGLKNLSKDHFKSRHHRLRFVADLLLALTVVGVLLVNGFRAMIGKSFFFSGAPTGRERTMEAALPAIKLQA